LKVFIAGHNGMVGQSLMKTMPKHYKLITASRIELDLKNYQRVLDFLLQENPDTVIMAAAKVGGIGANSVNQRSFLVENLGIQNSVISAAADAQVANLIFLGSSCIYPKFAPQPISENALLTGPLEPTNEGYAIAKIAGIRLVRAIFDELRLNYFSLMPTNLYGPHDNFDLQQGHVVAALMRRFHSAKNNGDKKVTVWGTGQPKREFMHVDDFTKACWLLLKSEIGGELINVGTGMDISIREFAVLMAKIVGFEGEIAFDITKPDGTPRKLLDISKIHSLGWRHEIELEKGIGDTYDWFQKALMKGEVRGF
jgi:GDP-L-fucose synthase